MRISFRSPLAATLTATLTATLGAVLLSGASVLAPLTGSALPPGGASSDTAGTSGSVSPTTVKAGDRITFSIQGFPAGEVVSVKIDDGEFCSAKGQHGACVVHQQKVGKDGSARGSFALPDDVGAGNHWLRFLASAEMLDDDGNYLGVKPYSLRGNTDFAVVAPATSGGSTPSESGTGGTGAGDSASGDGDTSGDRAGGRTDSGSNDGGTTPGVPAPSVSGAADPTSAPDPGDAADSGASSTPAAPGAVPADGAAATEDQPVALRVPELPVEGTAEAAPLEENSVPWIGAAILAGCVLLCSGLVAALRFGRRP